MQPKSGRDRREQSPAGAPLLQGTSAVHQVEPSHRSASAVQRPMLWEIPRTPSPPFPVSSSQVGPQGFQQMARHPSWPALPQPTSYSFTVPQTFGPKVAYGNFNHQPAPVQQDSLQGKMPSYTKMLTVAGFAVLGIHSPMLMWFSYLLHTTAVLLICGPMGSLCSLLAVYLTKWGCKFGCMSDASRMLKLLNFFCVGAIFFDVIAITVVPLVMYSTHCPDEEEEACPHDLPFGQGLSVAAALVVLIHFLLCILVSIQGKVVVDTVLYIYNKQTVPASFPGDQRFAFRTQAPSLGYHSFPWMMSQPVMHTLAPNVGVPDRPL